MASDTGNDEEFSDSDADDGLDEDIQALKRACALTGASFEDMKPSSGSANATSVHGGDASTSVPGGTVSISEDDEEDDLEYFRKIQMRFSGSAGVDMPLFLKPLCSLPPATSDDDEDDDDDDDDLGVLRAIEKRFGKYEDASRSPSKQNHLQKPETCAPKVAMEEEHSGDLFGDTNDAHEGFSNCADGHYTGPNLEPFYDNVADIHPSCSIEWHKKDTYSLDTSRVSGFPKSAQLFIDAIRKNRSCQKFLRNKLGQTEARIEENKKLMARVKILKDFQLTCKKRIGRALSQKKDARAQLISVAKQRSNLKVHETKILPMYYGPAENSHVAKYRIALTQFPLSFSRKKWSKEEQENLAKGIKQQFQEMLLQKSVDLISNADGYPGGTDEFDSIVASIRDIDITAEDKRLFLPKVNWEQLASMYVEGRSGAECEARWINCEDPLINNQPWKTMEDKYLLHTVQQKGIDNWIDIAVSLGTNRTPYQCLSRYQRSLNASILKREWTEAEDNELRAAVETYGESNWQVVASTLDGRTGTQCSNRWLKSLHPARKRVGKWTPDEDKRLKVAVMLFGSKTWKKISKFVPGRTHVQSRERWVNSLDPSLNLNSWTEEEDSKLKEAITEHGYCWYKIAACVPPRTDNQCWRRWKTLFPEEVPWLQAARKVQKAALISNFVDRESERPALGPNDFVALRAITSVSESEIALTSKKARRKLSLKRLVNVHQNCSAEAPASNEGNEDKLNKKRATRKRSKCKKNNGSTEDLSSCPDPTLLTTSPTEEIGTVDVNSGRKKRIPSRTEKQKPRGRKPRIRKTDTASGDNNNNNTATKNTGSHDSELFSLTVGDHHLSREDTQLLSLAFGGDHHLPLSREETPLLMITNSEEVTEYGQSKCTLLPDEPHGASIMDEANTTCGGNNSISKEKRVRRPRAKKNSTTTLMEDGFSSCQNNVKKKKRTQKRDLGKNKDTEPSEKPSEVEIPQLKQGESANPTVNHSSNNCPKSTMSWNNNGEEIVAVESINHSSNCPTVGARRKKTASKLNSRTVYSKLLDGISDMTHYDEFGINVVPLEKRQNNVRKTSMLSSNIEEVNSSYVGVRKRKRASKKSRTGDDEIPPETEIADDDMTLASFLSLRTKKRAKMVTGHNRDKVISLQNENFPMRNSDDGIQNMPLSCEESREQDQPTISGGENGHGKAHFGPCREMAKPESSNFHGGTPDDESDDSCSAPPGFEFYRLQTRE